MIRVTWYLACLGVAVVAVGTGAMGMAYLACAVAAVGVLA